MSELGPLVGEPLALDLVNSRPNTPDGPIDFLATVAGLRTWLACVRHRLPSLTPQEVAAPTKADLDAVRAVRDHTASAIECARQEERPPEQALRGLNEAMRAAPLTRELVRSGSSVHSATRRIGPRGTRVAAPLAEAAHDLLVDPAVTKIRTCEAPWCILLFLPGHPRRRWCSPTICGNRARVARFHERRKATQKSK